MGTENVAIAVADASHTACDDAFEEVCRRHESDLLRYAARMLNDAGVAQDIVQLVFLRYLRCCEKIALSPASVKSWLYRVTHNLVVDHLRSERRRVRRETDGGSMLMEERQVHEQDQALYADQYRRVLTCLPRLPLPEREILVLRMQQGLSYREIAHVTGRTAGNVGCLLHHAVLKMKRFCNENKGSP